MRSKKLVLVDIHYLLVAQTGIRTYIEQLLESLGDLEEFELRCVPSKERVRSNDYFKKPGFIRSIIFHLYSFIWKQIQLPLLARNMKADVIIIPDYFAPTLSFGIPKLVVFHDAFFWEQPEHYNQLWLAYYKWVITLGLKREAHLMTVSNASRDALEQELNNTRIHVLHSPVPIRSSESFDSSILDRYHLSKGSFFLHIGVLEKRKNLLILIQALKELKDNYPGSIDLKLVLAGIPGPKRELDDSVEIENEVLRLGLKDDVILTGFITEAEKNSLLNSALAYTFPSYAEGFGFPVLEAFAHRIPVIVSENPALTEVGGNAVIIAGTNDAKEWAKKMNWVLKSDEGERSKFTELGVKRLTYFSKENFNKGLSRILREITNSK
jgi:glycosyltransferase involved in cell wall biosynthesis